MAEKDNFPCKETQFKKGQSGNPKGGRTGKRFQTIINELMSKNINYEDLDGKKKKVKVDEAVILSLIAEAIKPSDKSKAKAIEMLLDRVDGKVVQENINHGDQEIIVNIMDYSKVNDDE